MKLQSLSRFLNVRYSIIIALLVILFTSLVTFMNHSGIDDTIEYYIFYEADTLTDYYQPYDQVQEFHQGVKEYYWGKEQLPEKYKRLFGDNLAVDKMTMFEHDRSYIYVLPFALPSAGIDFYILHIFPFDEYEESNAAYRYNLQIAAVNLAIILILLMFKFNRQVANQVREFDNWVAKMSKQAEEPELEQEPLPIPRSIEFRELHQAAHKLQLSVKAQGDMRYLEKQRLKQEKDFLTSLSHELRTPIAVITAAVALLKKRNALSDKDQEVVNKLAKANNNMGLMTKTLLQVWRKQNLDTKPASVLLHKQVERIVSENAEHFPRQAKFELVVEAEQELMLNASLVELTLDNLLRNASQYSTGGLVACSVTGNKVVVCNKYNKAQQHEGETYGYGFGLYLVDKICEQQKWLFDVNSDEDFFTVTIQFNS